MTIAIARELRDDDVAFVGIGTGGRSSILANGIPTAACQLARKLHAPNLTLMLGPIINPDPSHQPSSYTDSKLIGWKCEAHIPGKDSLDCFKSGRISVSFVSAAQVDRFGNLNSVAIGDPQQPPRVRLVGPIAQADHMASPARNIVVNDLSARTFVERVDWISGAGYLSGPGARARAGLPSQGPWRVVTDRALFGFDTDSRELTLRARFPNVTAQEIIDKMQRQPPGIHAAPEIEPPLSDELEILRREIDPTGVLLQEKGA